MAATVVAADAAPDAAASVGAVVVAIFQNTHGGGDGSGCCKHAVAMLNVLLSLLLRSW